MIDRTQPPTPQQLRRLAGIDLVHDRRLLGRQAKDGGPDPDRQESEPRKYTPHNLDQGSED